MAGHGGSNAKLFVVAGLLVGLALALLVSPFASSSPDGLEKVAEDEGFGGSAEDHDLADSPLADYGVDGVDDERLSTGMSGVIGVLLTFGVGVGVFAVVRVLRPAAPERLAGDQPDAGAGSGGPDRSRGQRTPA